MENKMNHQARSQKSFGFEIKSIAADGTFGGYASVFGVVDSQRDVVLPGAFAASLKSRKQPVQLLWQHQWESPIGSITKLFEDAHGLYVQGKLLMEVARAKEAYALLKEGILRGLSIGYSVKRSKRDPETGVRHLMQLELWEISLVTLPANDAAQVTVVKQGVAPEAMLMVQLQRAQRALRN